MDFSCHYQKVSGKEEAFNRLKSALSVEMKKNDMLKDIHFEYGNYFIKADAKGCAFKVDCKKSSCHVMLNLSGPFTFFKGKIVKLLKEEMNKIL